MPTIPRPADLFDSVDAPLTDEARRAERSVLVAAAVGLGVGVVVPAAWADYPWTTSGRLPWLVWIVVLGPPVAAVIGAIRARSYRRGPLFWLTVALAVVVTILSPPALVWGGGSGAVAAGLLVASGLVLLVGHPHRWRVVGLGLLLLCVSLFGTMGFVAHIVDQAWALSLTASLPNLVAMVILIRRIVALRAVARC